MDEYWEAAAGLNEHVENLKQARDRLIAAGKHDEAAVISRSLETMQVALDQPGRMAAGETKH
ncbi:hypothetical protein [Pseudomonas aegrilactucae]|uniref:Uncharacterized protein n=1 Tax=Pseudomonas aegrilactucae TaxID=2854028 RepID=A0A9Q3ADG3_9PSED|nr:hypothetical protein [Pseudomonas aegrilactucae]MBV6287434.1 hypothetical protein [Pseudomonas aegrilactucae]